MVGINDCLPKPFKTFASDFQWIGADEGVIRCRFMERLIGNRCMVISLARGAASIVTDLFPAVDASPWQTKVPIDAF